VRGTYSQEHKFREDIPIAIFLLVGISSSFKRCGQYISDNINMAVWEGLGGCCQLWHPFRVAIAFKSKGDSAK